MSLPSILLARLLRQVLLGAAGHQRAPFYTMLKKERQLYRRFFPAIENMYANLCRSGYRAGGSIQGA